MACTPVLFNFGIMVKSLIPNFLTNLIIKKKLFRNYRSRIGALTDDWKFQVSKLAVVSREDQDRFLVVE